MNLHDVRNSFESRVAGIEKETSYLLGKLALVIRAQGIAVEIGDESPGSTRAQEGNFHKTVTAFPAIDPSPSMPVENSEPEPAATTTPESVEEPASYENVTQFTPAAIAEEAAGEVGDDTASAEAEAEAEIIAAEDEEPAEDALAEDASADQVEAAVEAQEEPEQRAEEPSADVVATMPEDDQPEAEVESAQDAKAQVYAEPADEIDEPIIQPWRVKAPIDSSEDTANPDEAADDDAGESTTGEAADCGAEPDEDAITGLRRKLVLAAAAEDAGESASQVLEEMSSQADVEVEDVVLETWQPRTEASSAENTPDSDTQSDDALVNLRKKLASTASDNSGKGSFLTLGKFLGRAK